MDGDHGCWCCSYNVFDSGEVMEVLVNIWRHSKKVFNRYWDAGVKYTVEYMSGSSLIF